MCQQHYNALDEEICDWYHRGQGICLKRGVHKGEICETRGRKSREEKADERISKKTV